MKGVDGERCTGIVAESALPPPMLFFEGAEKSRRAGEREWRWLFVMMMNSDDGGGVYDVAT